MCGGGGGGSNEEAKKDAEERHQQNLALQKEQMEEQKRQFELTRADNQARYAEQKAQAQAAPPPPPEKTAGVAAPALDSKRWAKGGGKRQYTNPPVKQATTATKSSAHAAKSLYIPT
tara:strand:- start:5 stop:355 length:351 start_codon:yes stop_codon:yes gene_type:complete